MKQESHTLQLLERARGGNEVALEQLLSAVQPQL